MSQYNDTGYKAFPVGAAIAQFLRVKMSSGLLVVAGLTDAELGVMRDDSFASGEVHTVALRKKAGTYCMVANGAITQYANVYTAASGKVTATNATGSILIGVALDAATADGDHIEVLRA